LGNEGKKVNSNLTNYLFNKPLLSSYRIPKANSTPVARFFTIPLPPEFTNLQDTFVAYNARPPIADNGYYMD
jgi:hypothetical protein